MQGGRSKSDGDACTLIFVFSRFLPLAFPASGVGPGKGMFLRYCHTQSATASWTNLNAMVAHRHKSPHMQLS